MSADLSLFLHSLATEFDAQAGVKARNQLLHRVGRRMATRLPLPECKTLESIELESNAILSILGWGQATMGVSNLPRGVIVSLVNGPTLAALGDPAGSWLGSAVAGLFEGWLDLTNEDSKITWSAKVKSSTKDAEPNIISIFAQVAS